MDRLRRLPPATSIAALAIAALAFWLMAQWVQRGPVAAGFWPAVLLAWALAWLGNDLLASMPTDSPAAARLRDVAVPAIFGITILFLWELVAKGFGIPLVLLPAPSDIWGRLISSLPRLRADFVQTFVRAVLPGWA